MSTKKTTIGGQAIIEGIVMKGPKKTCTVVRKPGGELVTKTEPAHHQSAFWRLPILRGAYTLFTAMKDGIVVFKDDGALVLANRAARAFLHIDKHIFFKSDKSSYGAFYGLVSDVCREAFESATERRVEFQEGDRIFEVSALLIPDRYQKGICLGVMAVVIDVTEARRLEARRKEFVSNVSHEFRTPMTLISGYAEMLRMWDEVTKEERTKEFLSKVL